MSKLRRTKPIYRILATAFTTILLTLLILSFVAPLPAAWRVQLRKLEATYEF